MFSRVIPAMGIDREWHDFPLGCVDIRYLRRALFVDLVNPDDGMHGYMNTADIFKFRLQVFFRWINDQRRLFTEDDLRHLDETKQGPLVDAPGKDLIDLPLIQENDFIQAFSRHKNTLVMKG